MVRVYFFSPTLSPSAVSRVQGCWVVQHAPDIYRACATPDNPPSAGSHPRPFLRAPRTRESSPCARWALSLELGVVMSKRSGPFLSEATVSLETEEGPCLPLPPLGLSHPNRPTQGQTRCRSLCLVPGESHPSSVFSRAVGVVRVRCFNPEAVLCVAWAVRGQEETPSLESPFSESPWVSLLVSLSLCFLWSGSGPDIPNPFSLAGRNGCLPNSRL